MIKNRLIPCVLLKGDLVVQSFGFEKYLPIGRIDAVIEFLMNWDVDEIVVIDMDASLQKRTIDLGIIERIAQKCFLPLTIGGGVKDHNFVAELLKVGADKVVVNSVVVEDPDFITRISEKYGRQFVTVSIDAKKVGDGENSKYMTFTNNGKDAIGETAAELAQRVEKLGAGEIFLNSIDRDGSRLGYDIDLLKSVSSAVKIPVIACGGVGKAGDLAEAITLGGCQAASAANIFNHTELSTIAGKAIMREKGLPIRIDSNVKYQDIAFDHLDRPI